MTPTPAYRSDIDGLRAVAVLTVVLYHYGIAPFSGGFIGVDVFFVISGYLITKNLFSDLSGEQFSLVRFYDRRFRRILPALLVVLVASLAAGYVLLLPGDFARLGESGMFAAFGFSNFYFLWSSGYFDPAAEMQPLLHTWSLAVEEQFYLFWPILMWCVWRLRQSSMLLLAMLAVIALASFASSVYWVEADQPVAFFMLHTRAWELAAGAALVFAKPIASRALGEAMGWGGLALISYAAVVLTAETAFPGWNALYPCVGAALLVWPKSVPTTPDRLLSLRPAVFIGLISYSLYLWHWPILVFFRHYANAGMPTLAEATILIALSIAAAWLSLHLVERPVRQMRFKSWAPGYTIAAGALAMGATAAIASYPYLAGGLPGRLDEQSRHYAAFDPYERQHEYSGCSVREAPADGSLPNCLTRKGGEPRLLILGDSYATQLALPVYQSNDEATLITIGNNGCRPVLDSVGRRSCTDLMESTFDSYLRDGDFDAVILAARWRNGNDIRKLRKTLIEILRSADHVYVVGQPIEYTTTLPSLLASASLPRRSHEISTFNRYEEVAAIEEKIKSSLEGLPVTYVSPLQALCDTDGTCQTVTEDNVPIQYDYGHLTREGARLLIDRLMQQGLLVGVGRASIAAG